MIRHYGNFVPGRTQLLLSFLTFVIFAGIAYFEDGGICPTADIAAFSSNTDDAGSDRGTARLKQTISCGPACRCLPVLPAMTRLASFEDNGRPRCLTVTLSPGNKAPPPAFS
jgi:hypothetical protein